MSRCNSFDIGKDTVDEIRYVRTVLTQYPLPDYLLIREMVAINAAKMALPRGPIMSPTEVGRLWSGTMAAVSKQCSHKKSQETSAEEFEDHLEDNPEEDSKKRPQTVV